MKKCKVTRKTVKRDGVRLNLRPHLFQKAFQCCLLPGTSLIPTCGTKKCLLPAHQKIVSKKGAHPEWHRPLSRAEVIDALKRDCPSVASGLKEKIALPALATRYKRKTRKPPSIEPIIHLGETRRWIALRGEIGFTTTHAIWLPAIQHTRDNFYHTDFFPRWLNPLTNGWCEADAQCLSNHLWDHPLIRNLRKLQQTGINLRIDNHLNAFVHVKSKIAIVHRASRTPFITTFPGLRLQDRHAAALDYPEPHQIKQITPLINQEPRKFETTKEGSAFLKMDLT